MKIWEIIGESVIKQDALQREEDFETGGQNALPGPRVFPTLDNSSPYNCYRFGIALAGSPDQDTPKTGPIGQHLITSSYTTADEEIIKGAMSNLGIQSDVIGTKSSDESPDVNTQSVLKPRGPIKLQSI